MHPSKFFKMEKIKVEELQENWYYMICKVENGKTIEITNGQSSAIMAPVEDEMYRIHTEHGDGP